MSRVTRSSSRLRLSESKENLLLTHDEPNQETSTSVALSLCESNVPVDEKPLKKSVKKKNIVKVSTTSVFQSEIHQQLQSLTTIDELPISREGEEDPDSTLKDDNLLTSVQPVVKGGVSSVVTKKRKTKTIVSLPKDGSLPQHSSLPKHGSLPLDGISLEPLVKLVKKPSRNRTKEDKGECDTGTNSELPPSSSTLEDVQIMSSVDPNIVSVKHDNFTVLQPPHVDDISTSSSVESIFIGKGVNKTYGKGGKSDTGGKGKDNIRVSQIPLPPPSLDDVPTTTSVLPSIDLKIVGKKINRKRRKDINDNISDGSLFPQLDYIPLTSEVPSLVEPNVVCNKLNNDLGKDDNEKYVTRVSQIPLPPPLDVISKTNSLPPSIEPVVVGRKQTKKRGKGVGANACDAPTLSCPSVPAAVVYDPLCVAMETKSCTSLEDLTVQDDISEKVSIVNSDLVVERKNWIESLFKVQISVEELRGGRGGDPRLLVEGEIKGDSGGGPCVVVVIRGLDAQRIHCKEYLTALCDPIHVDTLTYPSVLHDILTGVDTVRKVEQESHAHLRFDTDPTTNLFSNDRPSSLFDGASRMEIPESPNSRCIFIKEQLTKSVIIQGSDCLAVGLAMSALEDIIDSHLRKGSEGLEGQGDVTSLEDKDMSLDTSELQTPRTAKTRRWKKSSAILDTQLNKLSLLCNGDENEIDGFESMTTNDDDALKRTILSVLRDVTLVEEREQCSVDGLEDKARRVSQTKLPVKEFNPNSLSAVPASDTLVECPIASSNSVVNTNVNTCTPSVIRPPVKDPVPSDCDSVYIDWDVWDGENESFTAVGAGVNVVENPVNSSLASHSSDLDENPFAKAIFPRKRSSKGSTSCMKSLTGGKLSGKVDQGSITTRQRQPSQNLSPIQELTFGDEVSAVKNVVGNLCPPISEIQNSVVSKNGVNDCQDAVFRKRAQRAHLLSLVAEPKASKPDKIAQKPDKIVQKPDNIAQKSDKIAQRPGHTAQKRDCAAQKADKIVEKTDNTMQKSKQDYIVQKPDHTAQKLDNIVQKTDNAAQKPKLGNIVQERDNTAQKPDHTAQKPDDTVQKPDHTAQKSGNTAQKLDHTAQKADNTAQKPDHTAQKADNTAQKRDNAVQKPGNTAQKPDNTAQNPDIIAQKSSVLINDVVSKEKKSDVPVIKKSKIQPTVVSEVLPPNKRIHDNHNASIIDLTDSPIPVKMVADNSRTGCSSSTQLLAHNPASTGAPGHSGAMPDVINMGGTAKVTNPSEKLRYIVLDGSNIAMAHGKNLKFSCRGISLCVQYFLDRGHTEVVAFVPQTRQSKTPDILDQHILTRLFDSGHLIWTPARRFGRERIVCYDDRYILKLADMKSGIVVSNDNYRDIWADSPEYRPIISQRLLPVVFVGDIFMPPDDPLGRGGPTLDQFLKCDPPTPARSLTQNGGTSGCVPLLSVDLSSRVQTPLESQQAWSRIQLAYQNKNLVYGKGGGGGGGGGGAMRVGASTASSHRAHPYQKQHGGYRGHYSHRR